MTLTVFRTRSRFQFSVSLFPLLLIALTVQPLSSANAGEFSNHIGMRFVDIPAGHLLMGSCRLAESTLDENRKRRFLGLKPLPPDCGNPDPNAQDNETPQHSVNVSGFQLARTEVTLSQFKKFIAATGRFNLVNDKFMRANSNGDDVPVVWVSWMDVQAFINWLNKIKPANDTGTYRLPSEAEWEHACRAGGKHDFCGGNNANTVGWYYENGGWHPRPVAGKQANAFGLYDMSGNVDEWVRDCYHPNYNGAPTDGSAWISGCGSSGYVLRSNSWKHYEAKYARAAFRGEGKSTLLNGRVGFRVARSVRP